MAGGRPRPQQPPACPFSPCRLWRSIPDPWPTRCDPGVPPPPARSDSAQPSSTLSHTPLICPPHSKPISHTTSHPFASLARSRRHRRRPVVRAPLPRVWAAFGAVWAQTEPLAQHYALPLLMVSVVGRVAACMFVFCPAVVSCPCRAMSVRVRGAGESLRGRQRGVRWCEREACYEAGR